MCVRHGCETHCTMHDEIPCNCHGKPQEKKQHILLYNCLRLAAILIFINNTFLPPSGPVGFQSNNVPLDKGMFTSIEPGYYHDGEFGIRIEDVAFVVQAQTKYPVHEEPYLTFKVVSLVPYARNLIDQSLLSQDQIQYINKYYETIRQVIGPELQRRQLEEEYRWLEKNTESLSHASLLAASLGTVAVTALSSTLLPEV
ncbi:xaa-Pro aminopeptidase 2-like [Pseudonaja textilis]|uniref:xaa-Pro aminopeptidase 2-like n=1 Tax=Pseudonaja textilis TaxID=8673 RepID=UPI000EA9AC64|nr:xaa-Pro aminopeptidase 2-like [Pseudonaja textilis]XP_026580740.1 xaa-Pro aminopeptidase 2-like [Pseudonaja textilis]